MRRVSVSGMCLGNVLRTRIEGLTEGLDAAAKARLEALSVQTASEIDDIGPNSAPKNEWLGWICFTSWLYSRPMTSGTFFAPVLPALKISL